MHCNEMQCELMYCDIGKSMSHNLDRTSHTPASTYSKTMACVHTVKADLDVRACLRRLLIDRACMCVIRNMLKLTCIVHMRIERHIINILISFFSCSTYSSRARRVGQAQRRGLYIILRLLAASLLACGALNSTRTASKQYLAKF
jgi:hypothetical protein